MKPIKYIFNEKVNVYKKKRKCIWYTDNIFPVELAILSIFLNLYETSYISLYMLKVLRISIAYLLGSLKER